DGSADAELGARAWAGLSEFFTHRTGARIQDLGVVALTPGGLEGVDLLHITGRGRFTLDAAERAALVGFVEGGGTLLVDAWGGSAGFAQVARAELTQVFGPLEALERQDPVATGDFEGGTDLSRDIRYTLPGRRLLQTVGRAMPVRGQSLWTQQVHGRAAVFFSDLDLSAALAGVGIPGGAGYRPDSARRIVTNLAAWLVRET
ncbi:MAG: DUF4159 domain-containing protein, partial [Myxococcales bacterium]|nr:DUF4159 domain-containing protein [Myxococcales bacterium]